MGEEKGEEVEGILNEVIGEGRRRRKNEEWT